MPNTSKAIYRLTVIAMSVAVITLSSWISVPFTLSFTLQIFSIFLISSCFAPQISFTAVLAYIIIGLVGVPVFSGFNTGISAFMGISGGYLIGFLLVSLFLSAFRRFYFRSKLTHIGFMLIALLICYICGSIWYIVIYQPASPLLSAVTICVIPYLVPDIIKLLLVVVTFKKLYPYIKKLPI